MDASPRLEVTINRRRGEIAIRTRRDDLRSGRPGIRFQVVSEELAGRAFPVSLAVHLSPSVQLR